MSVAISLHLLAVIVWVGGMFFAYTVQRPASGPLAASQRLQLWQRTFARFFPWVWAAVGLLVITGYGMIFVGYGGFANVGPHVHLMQGLAWVMIGLFLYVFFGPYRGLTRALASEDVTQAEKHLGRIRRTVGVNTILGVMTAVVGGAGHFS